MWWLVTCLLAAALQSCVNGDGTHYKEGEKVRCADDDDDDDDDRVFVQITVYVNKVGPYFNPQETYHYYSLPVCRPNKVRYHSQMNSHW